jgi:quinol monooxygenase YgiN
MPAETLILVTGSVTARADSIEALIAASLAHVQRSRAETGCLSHDVSRSIEEPLRLTFVERWADRESLDIHFKQPGSLEFLSAVRALAAASDGMRIYQATVDVG